MKKYIATYLDELRKAICQQEIWAADQKQAHSYAYDIGQNMSISYTFVEVKPVGGGE